VAIASKTPVDLSSSQSSRWIERVGRIGLIARGLVYFLIGLIALQMAFGVVHTAASQQGAFRTIAAQAFGQVLLWVIAVGLAGYALWQLLAAFSGPTSDGDTKWGKKALYFVKTVIYLTLAWTAATIAAGAGGGASSTSYTTDLMKQDVGRLLVGLVGVAILIAGLVLVWQGWTTDFEKKLKRERMSAGVYAAIRRLGQVGYVARGVVFALVGILVSYAAISFEPSKARGVDAALQAVAQAPGGQLLLTLTGVGLMAFGLYSCAEARYRRFEA
jgi:hypothetical protein